MSIEIFGVLGFGFVAILLATIAYERRMDVLYGPYIQGRAGSFLLKRFRKPASSAIARLLALESQKTAFLPSIGAH
jgi:hypothetical protein